MRPIMISILVCSIIVTSSFQVFGIEWTAEQKEILDLENKYWESIITKSNIETYSNLLHKYMSAWPASHKSPKGRYDTVNFVKYVIDNNFYNSFEINPKDIAIYSNVAIIFYDISLKGENGSDSDRVIHMWIKENGEWKMIGGMGASYKKLPRR